MNLKFHEACLAQPFDKGLLTALIANMKAHGFDPRFPVIVWHEQILDGRHRYEAAKSAKVEPVFEEFEGTQKEADAFAFRANFLSCCDVTCLLGKRRTCSLYGGRPIRSRSRALGLINIRGEINA